MFSTKGYEFAQENLVEHIEAIKPMLAQNHEETGVYPMPFNPDFERYLFLAEQGDIAFFTVRREDAIVGFALFFLDQEIQQKELRSATQSLNYVSPQHRGIGYAFMKFCDDILKRQGINSIWRHAPAKFDISKVYERMGYVLIEKTYLKRI